VEELPKIARYKPYYHELEKGKRYRWCSCGLSKKQPFCDGSHKGTDFLPVVYEAVEEGEEVLFCACKHSADQPFCDGAHNDLQDVYEEDDPNSEANRLIPVVDADTQGRAVLDGGCCVVQVNRIAKREEGVLKLGELISRASGAQHQSQFYAEVAKGQSPILSFGDSDVIIFVAQGNGELSISGRPFAISPEQGVYIRPQEAFSLHNPNEASMHLYISVCPLDVAPKFLAEMPNNFDDEFSERIIGIDPDKRQTMSNRFFQMLVDKSMGSKVVTQFIGDIPQSKAAMHRHLYEESIVVLKGEGYMWTENLKTRVTPGDVIFLPRKQIHSLECTSADGMMLVGVIYPGDNPSINY